MTQNLFAKLKNLLCVCCIFSSTKCGYCNKYVCEYIDNVYSVCKKCFKDIYECGKDCEVFGCSRVT